MLKKNEGEQVKGIAVSVHFSNYGTYQMSSKFFCSLKVNWLGEVKCNVVIPDIFPQLPVISVVRETETQLLPDVGAIVTCKVRSEHF